MCLLTPGQINTQCGHVECKSFYTLSKQSCLHLSQNGPKTNLQHVLNESSLIDGRTQENTQSPNRSPPLGSKTFHPITKRPFTYRNEASADEEIELTLNKKKIKPESRFYFIFFS